MKMDIHIMRFLILTGIGTALFSCGNFEKEVEVKLPEFHSQLVVEAYITKNEKVMVAVMETKDYFSEATLPFVNDATVILTHGTKTYTLIKNPTPNLVNLKWYNYMLPGPGDSLQLKAGDEIQIQVSDPKGR